MKYRIVMVTEYREDHPDETYYVIQTSILGLRWNTLYEYARYDRDVEGNRLEFATHDQAREYIKERIKSTRRVRKTKYIFDQIYTDY